MVTYDEHDIYSDVSGGDIDDIYVFIFQDNTVYLLLSTFHIGP